MIGRLTNVSNPMTTTETPPLLHLLRRDYFHSGRIPLRLKRHIDHSVNVPHDHEFMEISLVIQGKGVHYSALGRREIEVGDAFIVHPRAWHVHTECDDLVIFNCLLGLEVLERDVPIVHRNQSVRRLLEDSPNAPAHRGILWFHLSPESTARCLGIMEAMEGEERESIALEVGQIGYLLLLIVELARALELDEPQQSRSVRALPPVVLDCMRLLESKPAHPWTIEALATSLCFNRHYLMRLFKQHVGISIVNYLRRCRAERAAAYLAESDLPINTIAMQVGWPDPNYFARRFKEHFGVTATEYRESKAAVPPGDTWRR